MTYSKKTIGSIFLCGALLAAPCTGALAAPPSIDTPIITVLPTVMQLEEKTVICNSVTLQDTPALWQIHGNLMVPLRHIAEALGFTVTWDEDSQSAHLDDGTVNTTVTIGLDSYYMASSQAIGMSAPTALGQAPLLIGGNTTYVPATLFGLLACNMDYVAWDGQTLSITYPAPAPEDSVQIPNPIQDYATIQEARDAAGFDAALPTVPQPYQLTDIQTISHTILQLVYQMPDGAVVTVRAANGDGDISGDYNRYAVEQPLQTEAFTGTLRGDGSVVNCAVWTDGSAAYSLSCENGLDLDTVLTIVQSV